MSNLVSKYEISVWGDDYQTENNTFLEQKKLVIGASDLLTQSRALNPTFKRGVNGTKELSFQMYYKYIDNITGLEIDNPFVKYLTNETKLKLHYKNKWYDLIIKDIQEDSSSKLFKYTATDQHINELSKNGFGLTLDTQLENNIGTVAELGEAILKNTGWTVESESIPQKTEDNLIEIVFSQYVRFYNVVQLMDEETVEPIEQTKEYLDFFSGDKIYIFYSCLKNMEDRFQFIYSNEEITKNQDRIIQNKNCKYYIDKMSYIEPQKIGGQENLSKYALKCPSILGQIMFTSKISNEYKGEKYIFSRKQLYNAILDRYVTEYRDDQDSIIHEYTTTEFEAPILIQNLVTNTDFKSTSGWTGQYVSKTTTAGGEITYNPPANKNSEYGAQREVKTSPDILQELIDNAYDVNKQYIPYIELNFQSKHSIVINSGPYDNKKVIDNFSPKQEFVLVWQCIQNNGVGVSSEDFLKKLNVSLAEYQYNIGGNCYISNNKKTLLTFTADNQNTFEVEDEEGVKQTYYYSTARIIDGYKLTKQQFQASKYQLFFQMAQGLNEEQLVVNIKNLQFFPRISNDDDKIKGFITPTDQTTATKIITKYHYFYPDNEINKKAATESEMQIFHYLQPLQNLKPSYLDHAEKVVTLSVKQSNYFNAAQSLSEVAQCWADFEVKHDEAGYIQEKKVKFKNYIGKNNFAGFRYGVNLKKTSRILNSKSIVSKLIVQDAINEYANNGFCSISRAASNETGENYIYDFSHYIRQNQLNQEALWDTFYNLDLAKGKDINENDTDTNLFGFYFRLSNLNKKISDLNDTKISLSEALIQAQAELQVATNGKIKSEEEHEAAALDFSKLAGYEYKTINSEKEQEIRENEELTKYFTKVATYEASYKQFSAQEAELSKTVSDYEESIASYEASIKKYTDYKSVLIDLFETTYARFIQEGTWNKGDSIDDEKYYLEAKSVAYTSAQPQITYSISVQDLSSIPEYKEFNFDLGDKTWIEDVEYFGYDEFNNPYREEVVLTEITDFLDEPDKTTIRIQNYKNQFQDLFQRITASVQTVNYSSGAWNNASEFMQADTQTQSSFITKALNNAETVLQNSGEQSVVIDKEGITVTDLREQDQKIRIVSGAIMLGKTGTDGRYKWEIGMTANGISAKNITAGTLNTQEVVIMNGDYPTFRWDAKGITAFDFTSQTTASGVTIDYNFNPYKGVRFDRFGICGFNGVNGQSWHPTSLDEIRNNSNFALNWDGLFLKIGNGIYSNSAQIIGDDYKIIALKNPIVHETNAILGRTNGVVYNAWQTDPDKPHYNFPIYDPKSSNRTFTKVLAIGDDDEDLVIYDDGTLVANNIKLTGSIEWTSASSPSKNIYAKFEYVNSFKPITNSLPQGKSEYQKFPDSDSAEYTGWHKNSSSDDSYWAHTDDGGTTWQGPFLISGKEIVDTIITYATAKAGTPPDQIAESSWGNKRPSSEEVLIGHNIYTRFQDKFNNGDLLPARYSIDGGRTANVELSKYAVQIPASSEGAIDSNVLKQNSTIQVFVYDGIIDATSQADLEFEWSLIGKGFLGDANTDLAIGDNKKITTVRLSEMLDSSVIVVVTVKVGTMVIGTKGCTIVKNYQGVPGDDAVLCYISSSSGMIIEEKREGITTLTAHLLVAGQEIDPSGEKFVYSWYYQNSNEPLKDQMEEAYIGKEIEVPLALLKNQTIYFKAIKAAQ